MKLKILGWEAELKFGYMFRLRRIRREKGRTPSPDKDTGPAEPAQEDDFCISD